MTRAFVALPLPDETREMLARVQEGLSIGRLVPPENMHLTLAFLDDQPGPVLSALHEALSEIEAEAPELRISGLDVFGGNRPRLVFAAVEKTKALSALREAVRSATRKSGIELARERFRPHVTLARLPHRLPPDAFRRLGLFLADSGALRLDPVWPASLGLFASHLTPDGPVYEDLALYPLR